MFIIFHLVDRGMRVSNPVDLIIVNSKHQILLAKRTEKEQGSF